MTYAPLPHEHPGDPAPQVRRRTPLGIAVRVVAGLVVAAIGAVHGLLWLLAAGFACDENCDDRSTSWHDHPDAWQWSALSGLGIACFALCAAFAVSLAGRSPRISAALLAAAALTGLAPWIFSATG